jgi:hypothetical protein
MMLIVCQVPSQGYVGAWNDISRVDVQAHGPSEVEEATSQMMIRECVGLFAWHRHSFPAAFPRLQVDWYQSLGEYTLAWRREKGQRKGGEIIRDHGLDQPRPVIKSEASQLCDPWSRLIHQCRNLLGSARESNFQSRHVHPMGGHEPDT